MRRGHVGQWWTSRCRGNASVVQAEETRIWLVGVELSRSEEGFGHEVLKVGGINGEFGVEILNAGQRIK